jgi:hypothetical protein
VSDVVSTCRHCGARLGYTARVRGDGRCGECHYLVEAMAARREVRWWRAAAVFLAAALAAAVCGALFELADASARERLLQATIDACRSEPWPGR